jgi:hypothetical protein
MFFEHSSTVHQYVDVACGMRETILPRAVEKIGTDCADRVAVGHGKIGSSLIGCRLISAMEDDVGTFAKESQSSRMADSAGGARD